MSDDGWQDLTLVLRPTPEGHEGTMSIGPFRTFEIKGWHRTASGVVKARAKVHDPAFDAIVKRQDDLLRGG